MKNLFRKLLICWIVTASCMLSGSMVIAAQSRYSLDQKLKQTNNQRYYYQQKKKQVTIKLKSERNKLNQNQQKLEYAQVRLQATTAQYNTLTANLSSMETQLNKAINDFREMDIQMKSRIRQIYKHQRTGMFESIMTSPDINTLLDTIYFQKIILREDYKRMQAVKAKANQIAALKAQVQAQRRLVEASIKDINDQKSTIQSSIAENKVMIDKLNKDKNFYERSERELARQSASIQNMIESLTRRNSQSGGTQVKVSSSGFIYPISGPITSQFGWRTHPIFKSRIFHSGIDIGGPNGGTIKASNDGKVIYAGWYGGYGKVVILDHGVINGKPITTLYGHMSAITVSNGQFVKKGQQVGREGSTGYSTGPHCHFEVRVNGKPTNPLNYI